MMTRGFCLSAGLAGAALLALAGCHAKTSKSEDQRKAGGQVLPGSISDAMIHYDSLQSQPPLAPRVSTSAASVADSAASADSAAGATSADAGAPAEVPAPAAPSGTP